MGSTALSLQSVEAHADTPGVQWADVILTSSAALAAVFLVFAGQWIPGWKSAALTFVVIASGPPVLRFLAHRYPRQRFLDVLGSFWLLPAVGAGHGALQPLLDGLNPKLWDARLALTDLRLFGAYPAVVLGEWTAGWINDVLLLCYYSYFIWPAALGACLYVRGRRGEYEQYALALSVLYVANFVFYLCVPAIGPRYFLTETFSSPLSGTLAPWLESMMRTPTFTRDCFPSGHTATTILVLTFAFRHHRRFFWVMLPVGVGLIAATLVGRFHYGTDVLCAVPFAVAAMSVASALARLQPGALMARVHGYAVGHPVRV